MELIKVVFLCRTNGYFNINDIQTAMMEANGKISFLPKSGKRPATPDDLNIKDIFLGICDSSGNLSLYPKEDIQNSHDWFE